MSGGATPRPLAPVRDALAALGKHRLSLGMHDAAFPAVPGHDTGRGSPGSTAGHALLELARGLGFDALVLGPQGQTSRDNASPYDGTLFSRSTLSIDPVGLAMEPLWAGLFDEVALASLVRSNPRPDGRRVPYRHVFDAYAGMLDGIYGGFVRARDAGRPEAIAVDRRLAVLRAEHRAWMESDGLYEALAAAHGGAHFRHWGGEGEQALDACLYAPPPGREAACQRRLAEMLEHHSAALERHALGQLVLEQQHARFRESARALGLALIGDAQVGLSSADAWRRQALLLPGYRLGAPPSRTNPEGQPWGLGVLDPSLYRAAGEGGAEGPALEFIAARIDRLLDGFDGLRVDHPHGLVCPWVYRVDDEAGALGDALRAVQHGARLFASPDLPDHPALARYAIAGPEQLDRGADRWADGWVRELEPAQVDAYAVLVDAVVERARLRGLPPSAIACEVLSTLPRPLAHVLTRHGLGRFRVTQKADVSDPDDVYRGENAKPEDWIMMGNHDTAPIWSLADGWRGTDHGRARATYLAKRLRPDGDSAALAEELALDPRKMVHGELAAALASPARHVMIYFTDLFGMRERYNAPGVVDDVNWTLRLPPDFAARYRADVSRGEALCMRTALALALRARGAALTPEQADLATRLDEGSFWKRSA